MVRFEETGRQGHTSFSLTVRLQDAGALEPTAFASARGDITALKGGPRTYDDLENRQASTITQGRSHTMDAQVLKATSSHGRTRRHGDVLWYGSIKRKRNKHRVEFEVQGSWRFTRLVIPQQLNLLATTVRLKGTSVCSTSKKLRDPAIGMSPAHHVLHHPTKTQARKKSTQHHFCQTSSNPPARSSIPRVSHSAIRLRYVLSGTYAAIVAKNTDAEHQACMARRRDTKEKSQR